MGHWDGKIIEVGSDDDKSSDNGSEKILKLNKTNKLQPIILNDILSSWNNFSISYYIKSLNFNKQRGSADTDFLSQFCRIPALIDFPITLISSELFSERFYHTIPSMPHSTIVGQSEQSLVKKPYMENSSFFQSGILNDTLKQFNSSSLGTSPTRISELSCEPNAELGNPNCQISILNIPEKSIVSCSSTNSTNSYISNSSPSCTVLTKGIINCVRRNGSLCFLFQEGESSMIYMANSCKIDSSADIALDYLYLFHRLKGNKAQDYVGKMTVLNHLVLKPNMSRLVETEFVLFGVKENTMESQGVTSSMEKSKGFSTKISKIFRSNHPKNKSTSYVDYPNVQLEAYSQVFDDSEFRDHIKYGFEPNLERVAILVKSSLLKSEKKVEHGGWGLKFLEKVRIDHIHSNTINCETDISVLIPSGFHGYPTKGGKGPSTLIERWKSNGSCDCGGWDVGCPITEFKNENSTLETACIEKCSQEDCKIVKLFKKGTKHVEPAWKMINTSENVYTMYFQPSLSALEAFSIGLAIIHTQTLSLY